MKIEQIYTGCLAEAAYYIESDGEAAIIDPLREVNPYLKKAEKNKTITEDDLRKSQDEVQKITDRFTAEVDKHLAAKEKEMMEV